MARQADFRTDSSAVPRGRARQGPRRSDSGCGFTVPASMTGRSGEPQAVRRRDRQGRYRDVSGRRDGPRTAVRRRSHDEECARCRPCKGRYGRGTAHADMPAAGKSNRTGLAERRRHCRRWSRRRPAPGHRVRGGIRTGAAGVTSTDPTRCCTRSALAATCGLSPERPGAPALVSLPGTILLRTNAVSIGGFEAPLASTVPGASGGSLGIVMDFRIVASPARRDRTPRG